MTSWQALRQIAFLLVKRTWPDSPTSNVFANVKATQAPTPEALSELRFPLAFVRVLDAEADPHSPQLKEQRFEVLVAVAHTGDYVGEAALVGGNRSSQGTSKGRGLLEVEEQVYAATDYLAKTSGLKVHVAAASAADAEFTDEHGYVATRSYTVIARGLNGTRDYPAQNHGKNLTGSVAGPTVSLSWTLVERFDLHAAVTAPVLAARGRLILRRVSGSSAPTSITDGTGVALSSNYATSATDTPGSGTFTYGLFAQHDEFGDNVTSLRNSVVASKTVTV